MQIVIEIKDELYAILKRDKEKGEYLDLCERAILNGTPLPKGHGRLIDAQRLSDEMYHAAFEIDTPLQRWDSGCWIRYKLFEDIGEKQPTIIKADKAGENNANSD